MTTLAHPFPRTQVSPVSDLAARFRRRAAAIGRAFVLFMAPVGTAISTNEIAMIDMDQPV